MTTTATTATATVPVRTDGPPETCAEAGRSSTGCSLLGFETGTVLTDQQPGVETQEVGVGAQKALDEGRTGMTEKSSFSNAAGTSCDLRPVLRS